MLQYKTRDLALHVYIDVEAHKNLNTLVMANIMNRQY